MKKDNLTKEAWTDKAAEKIAGTGIKIKAGWANRMNRLTRNLSNKKLKVLLVIFCITAGGYSVYLFGDGLFSSEPNSPINVQPLSVPKHADQTGDETLRANQYIDDYTYRELKGFKNYMDSLKALKHPIYDSVVSERPGLLDSVQVLIDLYEQYK